MKLSCLTPRNAPDDVRSNGSNCYILVDEGEAAVIDPSVSVLDIMRILRSENAKLTKILLTHAHADHMFYLTELRTANPEAAVMLHADDGELLTDGEKNVSDMFFGEPRDYGPADKLLIEGDIITLGRGKIRVMHTPGHTRGSACYLLGNVIFSGDTVFADGYGRCDLYSGNPQKLNNSLMKLRNHLVKNPKTVIYPGHGKAARLFDALNAIYNSNS